MQFGHGRNGRHIKSFQPENWMKHFKIKFYKAHRSGHASKHDIIELIKKINPKVLIPIHTESPDEFKKIHGDVKMIKKWDCVKV